MKVPQSISRTQVLGTEQRLHEISSAVYGALLLTCYIYHLCSSTITTSRESNIFLFNTTNNTISFSIHPILNTQIAITPCLEKSTELERPRDIII